MMVKKQIRVLSHDGDTFKCMELGASSTRNAFGAASKAVYIYVKGDIPTVCPFLSISGAFERKSSTSFVLVSVYSVERLKLSKKELYQLLVGADGKKIIKHSQKGALNVAATTAAQCLLNASMTREKTVEFGKLMLDYFDFDKTDRFRLAALVPTRVLKRMNDEDINDLYQTLQEKPWLILFDNSRKSIGLDFKGNVSYEAVERWNRTHREDELPYRLKEAFELYERILDEQQGIACDVTVPFGAAFGWLLANNIVVSTITTCAASLESDAATAKKFAERLCEAKDKILLVEGIYSIAMRKFIEEKFGLFNPIACSDRLDIVHRTVGHGSGFTGAAAAPLTVFVGADAITAEKLVAWIEKNHLRTTHIILAGTSGTQRYRLFDSLLNVWPEKVLEFTETARFAPVQLTSMIPERWYAEAKESADEVVVVTDDDNVEVLCELLGKDPNVYRVGDVVRYQNREYTIENTRVIEMRHGKRYEKYHNVDVKVNYQKESLYAEVFFKTIRGVTAKPCPLKRLKLHGLKHAVCIGSGEFVERVPAVVLATRTITPALLQFACTKAAKVFHVGAVEIALEPPRKRRRFDALERLL
jgi:hypothetical protein